MNHIFAKLEQLAQLVSASLVLVLAINLMRAIAAPEAMAEPAAQSYIPPALSAPLQQVALRPAEMRVDETSALPMLVRAGPGEAHVFAQPQSLVQVQVEAGRHVCARSVGISDETGMLSLPVAATRNCTNPRVVVLH